MYEAFFIQHVNGKKSYCRAVGKNLSLTEISNFFWTTDSGSPYNRIK